MEGQRRRWRDELTDDQRARRFRDISPEQFLADVQRRGFDFTCTDPVTLRAAATIHVAALARERAAVRSSSRVRR